MSDNLFMLPIFIIFCIVMCLTAYQFGEREPKSELYPPVEQEQPDTVYIYIKQKNL